MVSLCLPCHLTKFLPWADHQIRKMTDYLEKKEMIYEVLICTELPQEQFKDFIAHTFIPVPKGTNVGRKRNILCDNAKLAFIAMMDQDDWYADYRLYRQVQICCKYNVKIVSLNRMFCYDVPSRRSYYVTSGSESCLLAHRDVFIKNRFEEVAVSEGMGIGCGFDTFVENDNILMIAISHGNNSTFRMNENMNLGNINEHLDAFEVRFLYKMNKIIN